jgi:hypothetical protein
MSHSYSNASKTNSRNQQPISFRNNLFTLTAVFAGVVLGIFASLGFVGSYVNARVKAETSSLSRQLQLEPASYATSSAGECAAGEADVKAAAAAGGSGSSSTSSASSPAGGLGGGNSFVTHLVKGSLIAHNTATISNTGTDSTNTIDITNTNAPVMVNTNVMTSTNTNAQGSSSGSATTSANTTGGASTSGGSSNNNDSSTSFSVSN